MVPELERNVGELEVACQTLRVHQQKTCDNVTNDIGRALNNLSRDVDELRSGHGSSGADLDQAKVDLAEQGRLLHETRGLLDENRGHVSGLQKSSAELQEKEAQLSGKLEGWKSQWSKLHPALENLKKEATSLKQGHDHHETIIFTLQKGQATTWESFEALRSGHASLGDTVKDVQDSLGDARLGVAEHRDKLAENAVFVSDLRSGAQRTELDLSKACLKLDGLASKHHALCEDSEKTRGNVDELTREQRKAGTNMKVMQHELEQVHTSLSSTRGQLDTTNGGLHDLRNELRCTNDALQKLGHGVDSCRASFSGLQRGFMDTGAHLASRPLSLPKLPAGSPKMGSGSPRGQSPRASWPSPGLHREATPDTTQPTSNQSSRRGSLLSDSVPSSDAGDDYSRRASSVTPIQDDDSRRASSVTPVQGIEMM
jgi:predicted  nucleic acid-binding Zn-ribbon protein